MHNNYLCTCDLYSPVHSDSDAGEYSIRVGGEGWISAVINMVRGGWGDQVHNVT